MTGFGNNRFFSTLNKALPPYPEICLLAASVIPSPTRQLDGGVPRGGDKQLLTSGLAPIQGRGLSGVLLVHPHGNLCHVVMREISVSMLQVL